MAPLRLVWWRVEATRRNPLLLHEICTTTSFNNPSPSNPEFRTCSFKLGVIFCNKSSLLAPTPFAASTIRSSSLVPLGRKSAKVLSTHVQTGVLGHWRKNHSKFNANTWRLSREFRSSQIQSLELFCWLAEPSSVTEEWSRHPCLVLQLPSQLLHPTQVNHMNIALLTSLCRNYSRKIPLHKVL